MAKRSMIEIMKNLPILFRKVDAEKWTEGASVFLNRAIRKGWVYRIQRGYYVNSYLKGWPEVEETGCYLRAPAYVSGEWALHVHAVLLQVPQVCMVITLQGSVGRSRTVRYQEIMLESSRIAPPLFFGFERRGKYDLATPEKALLDLLYLRGRIPLPDELELSELDPGKLLRFSEKFPRTVQKKIRALIDNAIPR
jgi:hypothetical protein